MIYYFYRLKFFSSILIQSCLLIYPYLFVYCTHKPMNMTYNFFVIHQYFLANRWRNNGKTMEMVRDFFLGGGPKSLQMVTAAMKLKDICSRKEKL